MNMPRLIGRFFLAGAVGIFAAPISAVPVELITNGDFSAGLAGWTVTDAGSGSFFADTVGTTTPLSGFATSAAGGGVGGYAVSDQGGPGTHALTQAFSVASGTTSLVVSFDLFANDQSGAGPLDTGLLDHTGGPNQHARVDILTAGAPAFSTAPADIVATLLAPFVDPGPLPNPFTGYVFDVTALVAPGATYQLRFAETDNQFFFNLGVDNVSIQQTAVPEPATLLLLGAGFLGLGWRRRSRAI